MPKTVAVRTLSCFASLAVLGFWAQVAEAAPRGSEFDLSLTPAAGGMEGVGVVRPQDPVAMLFGNPSTLTQLEGRNAFTLGTSFVAPRLEARGTDPFTFAPFDGASRETNLALPHAAAIHRLTKDLVVGFGFTGISGLGSDFRDVFGPESPAAIVADLGLFGGNMVGAYRVTPELSVGGALTVGIGNLQVGVVSNTANVHDFGVGGTVGATYDLTSLGIPLQIGGTWKSELKITYENVTRSAADKFSDFTLEQPQEVSFGIATTDALLENTLLEFDFRFKNWNNARGYSDFWKDQYLFSLGGQQKIATPIGLLFVRAGYTYGSELVKDAEDLGGKIGEFTQLFFPGPGIVAPITPGFIQLFQATATDGYWRQSVSFGIGYEVLQGLRLDLNTSYAFDGEVDLDGRGGPPIHVDGSIFSAGMGFTWTFE